MVGNAHEVIDTLITENDTEAQQQFLESRKFHNPYPTK